MFENAFMVQKFLKLLKIKSLKKKKLKVFNFAGNGLGSATYVIQSCFKSLDAAHQKQTRSSQKTQPISKAKTLQK